MIKKIMCSGKKDPKDFRSLKLTNISITPHCYDVPRVPRGELYWLAERDDLGHLDLAGADFTSCELKDIWFDSVDLRGAKFDDAVFENVHFFNCLADWTMLNNSKVPVFFVKEKLLTEFCFSFKKDGAIKFDATRVNSMIIIKNKPIIGYKVVLNDYKLYIAMLRIPNEAKRILTLNDKCRAEYSEVLDIYGYENRAKHILKAHSMYKDDNDCLEYKVGKTVYPDMYDPCPYNVCSHGIHFFLTEKKAIEYADSWWYG